MLTKESGRRKGRFSYSEVEKGNRRLEWWQTFPSSCIFKLKFVISAAINGPIRVCSLLGCLSSEDGEVRALEGTAQGKFWNATLYDLQELFQILLLQQGTGLGGLPRNSGKQRMPGEWGEALTQETLPFNLSLTQRWHWLWTVDGHEGCLCSD